MLATTDLRSRLDDVRGRISACRRAVEAHGGWIWVEDNLPKGVTFCLRLPVRPTEPPVMAS